MKHGVDGGTVLFSAAPALQRWRNLYLLPPRIPPSATNPASTPTHILTRTQVRETETQKAALVRDAQMALSRASDLKQALNVFKEKSAKLDGELKSARTQLAAATSQAQAANRQWQDAENALREAEQQREKLVKTAQVAITKSTDLKQALNATKQQATKLETEVKQVRGEGRG